MLAHIATQNERGAPPPPEPKSDPAPEPDPNEPRYYYLADGHVSTEPVPIGQVPDFADMIRPENWDDEGAGWQPAPGRE